MYINDSLLTQSAENTIVLLPYNTPYLIPGKCLAVFRKPIFIIHLRKIFFELRITSRICDVLWLYNRVKRLTVAKIESSTELRCEPYSCLLCAPRRNLYNFAEGSYRYYRERMRGKRFR